MTCHVQTYAIAEIFLKCHCCFFLKGVICVCLGINKSTKIQMSKSTPKGDISVFFVIPFQELQRTARLDYKVVFLYL